MVWCGVVGCGRVGNEIHIMVGRVRWVRVGHGGRDIGGSLSEDMRPYDYFIHRLALPGKQLLQWSNHFHKATTILQIFDASIDELQNIDHR